MPSGPPCSYLSLPPPACYLGAPSNGSFLNILSLGLAPTLVPGFSWLPVVLSISILPSYWQLQSWKVWRCVVRNGTIRLPWKSRSISEIPSLTTHTLTPPTTGLESNGENPQAPAQLFVLFSKTRQTVMIPWGKESLSLQAKGMIIYSGLVFSYVGKKDM